MVTILPMHNLRSLVIDTDMDTPRQHNNTVILENLGHDTMGM